MSIAECHGADWRQRIKKTKKKRKKEFASEFSARVNNHTVCMDLHCRANIQLYVDQWHGDILIQQSGEA